VLVFACATGFYAIFESLITQCNKSFEYFFGAEGLLFKRKFGKKVC
jgi:hypothetical protein